MALVFGFAHLANTCNVYRVTVFFRPGGYDGFIDPGRNGQTPCLLVDHPLPFGPSQHYGVVS